MPEDEDIGRVADSVASVLEDTGSSEDSALVPGGGDGTSELELLGSSAEVVHTVLEGGYSEVDSPGGG